MTTPSPQSALTITEGLMTSGSTRHTARATGGRWSASWWSVSWLPGRTLTRNQAVTAMTIAELAAVTPQAVLDDPAAPLWWHLQNWAEELGLQLTAGPLWHLLTGTPATPREEGRAGARR